MAATTQVPLEIYLRSDFSPDAEYIDGEIKERPVGENDHSALQLAICIWFTQHAEAWNILVRPELRIQVNPQNFLVADVAILDANQPMERFAPHPPISVFEVLSPENSMRDMLRKLRLYQEMGIPHIWLIDPAEKIWRRFTGGGLEESSSFDHPRISFSMDSILRMVR